MSLSKLPKASKKISRPGMNRERETDRKSLQKVSRLLSSSSSSRLPFDDDVILDILAKGTEWAWRATDLSEYPPC